MLINFLLNAVISILAAPFTLLPTGTSLDINSAASTLTSSSFFPHLGWANDYFPLDEFVILLGIALSTWVIVYLIRFAIWVWNTIKP
jgi:hypothetical protein